MRTLVSIKSGFDQRSVSSEINKIIFLYLKGFINNSHNLIHYLSSTRDFKFTEEFYR